MSSSADLSSSVTTAVNSTLSTSASTSQPGTVQASTTSSSSPQPSNPSSISASASATADKGKGKSTDPSTLPTTAHAAPPSSTSPDPASMDATTTLAARNAIMAHLQNVGTASLHPLSQRAADISSAHESISRQREGVDVGAAKLGKESAKLEKEVEKTDAMLKDIGNVENWAQMLDRDLSVLEETLRIVDEEEGAGSEGEEGVVDSHEGTTAENERKKKAKGKDGWLSGWWQG